MSTSQQVFTVAFVGDVLAEPETLVRSITSRKQIASRTALTATPEEVEAARKAIRAEVDAALSAAVPNVPTLQTVVPSTQDTPERSVTLRLVHIAVPEQLAAMQPPPHVLCLCFTPVLKSTLEQLTATWKTPVMQMKRRPQLVVVGTRTETIASRKVMEKLPPAVTVPCEHAVEEACNWRAVDYYEVSAACNVNITKLTDAIGLAALQVPVERMTAERAREMRRACMKPVMATQSVWAFGRDPNTGKIFYYNRLKKGKSQWTRPDDYDGDEPDLTPAEREAEERAKGLIEEQRQREDRERQLEEQSRRDLAVHEERMVELERRGGQLTREVADRQARVEELRAQIAQHRREREALESERDKLDELQFARSTVDDDMRVEKEIQDAKAKLFVLEANAALAEQRSANSIEISEAMAVNHGLAHRLRALLEAQLDSRRRGSASLVKHDALTRELDDARERTAQLQSKLPLVRQSFLSATQELDDARAEERRLKATLQGLNEQIGAKDTAEDHRHAHVETLRRELEALDAKAAKMREKKRQTQAQASSAFAGSAADEQRATLEQQHMAEHLSSAVADAARLEVAARRQVELLRFLSAEHDMAGRKLVEICAHRAAAVSSLRDVALMGKGYPASNPHELRLLLGGVDGRIGELVTLRRSLLSDTSGLSGTLTGRKGDLRATTPPPSSSQQKGNKSGTPTGVAGAAAANNSSDAPERRAGSRVRKAAQTQRAFLNELTSMRDALRDEQRQEEQTERLVSVTREAERALADVRSRVVREQASVQEAHREAVARLSQIEHVADHQNVSPLDRLVTHLDRLITTVAWRRAESHWAAASQAANGGDGVAGGANAPLRTEAVEKEAAEGIAAASGLVTTVVRLFTEKMLGDVSPQEREAVTMALNATVPKEPLPHPNHPLGTGRRGSAGTTSGAAAAETAEAAARRGVAAALSYHQHAAPIETVTRLAQQQAQKVAASRGAYAGHAAQLARKLEVMQPPTDVSRDAVARAQMKLMRRKH